MIYLFNLTHLFPQRCPYCHKLILPKEIACEKCKSELPVHYAVRIAKGGYRCYSPFLYVGKYAKSIKALKFSNRTSYSHSLAHQMSQAIKDIQKEVEFDYITCVPMHKAKLNQRGYNQAKTLALSLAKITDIPYIDTLKKTVNNKEQHRCDYKERLTNVKGIYKTINCQQIKHKNILVVDDIITTGCTLGECCKTLNHSGAGKLFCVTVCATPD